MTSAGRRPLRVLLVCHEASRTGAPRVAVNIARALSSRAGARVITVVRWPGPLRTDLGRSSDRLLLEPLRRTRVALRRWRRTRRVAVLLETAVAWCLVGAVRPDVVYANTCLAACYVRPALAWRRRVVLHVHELEPLASSTLARYALEDRWRDIEVVACSRAVGSNLSSIIGRRVDRVIPSVPDAAELRRLAAAPWDSAPTGLVVGMCGTPDRRKGVDLFADVATSISSRHEGDPSFVWIGGRRPSTAGDAPVRFIGSTENPYPIMARFDVMAVTSREDPFPLAVIEAMLLGVPIVAFDIGGLREQLGDAGVLVPAGDIDGFLAEVHRLLDDECERERIGRAVRLRAEELFGIEAFGEAVTGVVTDRGVAC